MITRTPPGRLPTILVLFSDTGGAHRSAATAIVNYIEAEWPGQFRLVMGSRLAEMGRKSQTDRQSV
jgi:hypothetical protein